MDLGRQQHSHRRQRRHYPRRRQRTDIRHRNHRRLHRHTTRQCRDSRQTLSSPDTSGPVDMENRRQRHFGPNPGTQRRRRHYRRIHHIEQPLSIRHSASRRDSRHVLVARLAAHGHQPRRCPGHQNTPANQRARTACRKHHLRRQLHALGQQHLRSAHERLCRHQGLHLLSHRLHIHNPLSVRCSQEHAHAHLPGLRPRLQLGQTRPGR